MCGSQASQHLLQLLLKELGLLNEAGRGSSVGPVVVDARAVVVRVGLPRRPLRTVALLPSRTIFVVGEVLPRNRMRGAHWANRHIMRSSVHTQAQGTWREGVVEH